MVAERTETVISDTPTQYFVKIEYPEFDASIERLDHRTFRRVNLKFGRGGMSGLHYIEAGDAGIELTDNKGNNVVHNNPWWPGTPRGPIPAVLVVEFFLQLFDVPRPEGAQWDR